MHCKGRTFFIYNQILRQNFGYSLLFSYLCSENRTKGTVPVVIQKQPNLSVSDEKMVTKMVTKMVKRVTKNRHENRQK